MLKIYYCFSKKEEEHDVSWALLREVLNNEFDINFSVSDIIFNKNGKPYLKNNKFFFNISHSEGLNVVAISDFEVGVDVEKKCNLEKFLTSNSYSAWLNDEENKQIDRYSNKKKKLEFLAEVWTKKEAVLKMQGKGILSVREVRNINTSGDVFSVFFVKDWVISVIDNRSQIV